MPWTDNQSIDEIVLRQRRFEPPSPDLAERIIAASRSIAQPAKVGVFAWIEEMFESLMPHPAFALSAVLTLGLVIGASYSDDLMTYADNDVTQSYNSDFGAAL